jgi:hypothetical protein
VVVRPAVGLGCSALPSAAASVGRTEEQRAPPSPQNPPHIIPWSGPPPAPANHRPPARSPRRQRAGGRGFVGAGLVVGGPFCFWGARRVAAAAGSSAAPLRRGGGRSRRPPPTPGLRSGPPRPQKAPPPRPMSPPAPGGGGRTVEHTAEHPSRYDIAD